MLRNAVAWFVLALAAPAPVRPPFEEVKPSVSRISWSHDGARSPQRYLPETFGPGVAVFDYDCDGWMDLFFVNTGPSVFYHPRVLPRHALFHNNHDGTFTDVTAKAGLDRTAFFGMGAAAGDYDGDGYPDLYVTGFERSYLFHNNRDGTFSDVTGKAGVRAPGWSTSALWFDYDNDGKLDLFVPQFVDYTNLKVCSAEYAYGGSSEIGNAPRNQSYYCIPRIFDPMPSPLFHNNGNGTFTDVSRETGIAAVRGKGLGSVAADFNNDGYLDILQTNDTVENFLFINRGGKKFEERGLESGVAYSQDGQPRSSMGVDSADLDGDGWQDVFLANVDQQTFSLYHNEKHGLFSDLSALQGIAQATRLLSGFGLRFLDYDNDGAPDLIVANGHPDDMVSARMRLVQYREPLKLFHNNGSGLLVDVSRLAGDVFRKGYPARGLATGDLNNDGFPDVVVGVLGEAPLILRNTAVSKNRWIGLNLEGRLANPAGAGAMIRWSAGGKVRSRLVTAGGSYLSSHDPRIVLGLGTSIAAEWIEVRWPAPSSRIDRVTALPAGRYYTFREGHGPIER